MARILLGSDNKNATTIVPNTFIDEFMADANGEYVKIYLYLLRCMNSSEESISISKMADKFDHTEKDIKRALKYWEKMNLLRLEFDDDGLLTGIYFIDCTRTAKSQRSRGTDAVSLRQEALTAGNMLSGSGSVSAGSTVSAGAGSVTSAMPAGSGSSSKKIAKPQYTADDMKTFQKDETVQELFFVAENYLGHTLNTSEVTTILFWYDTLHFSSDLIEYLIEYCSENGHTSIRYMDKVALAWKDAGYRSVSEAKSSVKARSQTCYTVMKAFGISGRSLVPAETSLIDKWTKDYHFSNDIIGEACTRTMQAIHQPSFEYTDSILTSWSQNNVHTMEDIAASDLAFKKSRASSGKTKSTGTANKFNNFPQRSYNYEQLEQQMEKDLLNNALQ